MMSLVIYVEEWVDPNQGASTCLHQSVGNADLCGMQTWKFLILGRSIQNAEDLYWE
jgi:hypothetical protein